MATCEKCGKEFDLSEKTVEVTSLRILCPPCAEKRRREKTAGVERREAPPAAAPAASRPTRTGAPASSRASTAPAPARPAREHEGARRKPDLHGSPAAKLLHKPVSGVRQEAALAGSPDIQRDMALLAKRESKVMTIAWIVCGALLVAAGGTYLYSKAKKEREQAIVDARRKEVNEFHAKLMAFNLDDEAQAGQAEAFAESNKGLWETEEISAEVGSLLSRIRHKKDSLRERREYLELLTGAETAVRNASTLSADDLSKQRRTLSTLELKSGSFGTDFDVRVAAARLAIDDAYLTKLVDEARGLASKGSSEARAALTAFTKAEDELTKVLDNVFRGKDEAMKAKFRGMFEQLIADSDTVCATLFTPQAIEGTPWTDLLAPNYEGQWQNYGLKGWRLAGGKLEAVGPDPGSGIQALIAVPAAGGFRDFVLECEFTLARGPKLDFLFRLGKRVDHTVEGYAAIVDPTGFRHGETYTLTVSFIGSSLKVSVSPGDFGEYDGSAKWTQSRKGAFGVAIPEGTEVKITRLRIRQLRSVQ